MPKSSDILGMNARDQLYGKLNPSSARAFCNSKFATKVLLNNKKIPTAQIYGVLGTNEDVNDFEWEKLTGNFVIKPTNGNAGKGVAIFKTQTPDLKHWKDTVGRTWDLDDIRLHAFDILDGVYSTYGSNHNAIIEERVPIHPLLSRYAYQGTPDVRVIIFNHVPVMAMLRLPTKESEGRANLHQGAIGVGIDMATGITTHAMTGHGTPLTVLPGTKRKLNGIKIPQWHQLLLIAVRAADAAGLMYCGIDMFIHEEKGPMVVELNANPGLQIQIANQAGQRRRLERVQDLNVIDAEHGVKIGQALFAESIGDKVRIEDGLVIVSPNEKITVYDDERRVHLADALLNTGRFRSAISSNLVEELKLIDVDNLLWFQLETEEGKVPVVEVSFKLKNRRIKTAMVVSKKLNTRKHQIELGRKDLRGFLVGEST